MTGIWQRELYLIEEILHAWNAYEPKANDAVPGGDMADIIRMRFPPFKPELLSKQILEFRAAALADRIRPPSDQAPRSRAVGGYMSVAPVGIGTPPLYPLVTAAIRIRDDVLELTLRVVTFYRDTVLECVDAHGWRFDMADPLPSDGSEPKASHHRYPHVQRIVGWLPRERTFYPPGLDASKRGTGYGDNMSGPVLNESRPAFPLPVRTAAGITVAAMASLYGAKITSEILENVQQPPSDFRKEVNDILRMR